MKPENIIAQTVAFDEFVGHDYRIMLPMVTRYETNYRIDRPIIVVAIYRFVGQDSSGFIYKFYGVDIA